MSLNDELKAAQRRMVAMQEAEKKKAKSPRRSSKKASTEWTFESELIAYYLYRSDSSKFLRENYAKKRGVSARAMSLKIGMYAEMKEKGSSKSESEFAASIISRYGKMPVDEFQKVAISVLRGEFNSKPAESSSDSETPAVIKRS